MEYSNSVLVDPSTYPADLDGLCPSIPVRVHRNAELANRGALRAQKDWKHFLGTLPAGFSGTIGPEHNFASTCLPETLPARLEVVAYSLETAFIIDDIIDGAENPFMVAGPFMADFVQARNLVMGDGDQLSTAPSPVSGKMITEFTKTMIAIDHERSRDSFSWLERWATASLIPSAVKNIQSFDDYLEHRNLNSASTARFGLMIFAHALSIPREQQETCFALSQPFWLSVALANDYHSWERERNAASTHGDAFVSNAIWVLMEKHSMTCEGAKSVCRDRAKGYAAEYLQVLEDVKTRDDLCHDAKLLLNLLQLELSGNIVWGLQAPRYHPAIVHEAVEASQEESLTTGIEVIQEDTTEAHEVASVVESAILADSSHQEVAAENSRTESSNGDEDTVVAPDDGSDKAAMNAAGVTDDITVNNDDSIPVAPESSLQNVAAVRDVSDLPMEILDAPSRYLDSLPSKGIRDMVIDLLNQWSFKLPSDEVNSIKKTISLLHGASLMLDDIQDASQLRRGSPATHIVFGTMLTINSASYRFVDALTEVRKLGSEKCMDVLCDELRHLYLGQSHDIFWTSNLDCPTEEEYLAMVDAKTAGLFRMLARLLDAKSTSPTKPDVAVLTRFMTLLGRLFQIRDDYMNLTSAEYTKQKGFCEDLDEGKYSLPLVHALGRCEGAAAPTAEVSNTISILRNMLSHRHVAGSMTLEQKVLFLKHLKSRGSLEYTRKAMDALQEELKRLAGEMDMLENAQLRLLMEKLKV